MGAVRSFPNQWIEKLAAELLRALLLCGHRFLAQSRGGSAGLAMSKRREQKASERDTAPLLPERALAPVNGALVADALKALDSLGISVDPATLRLLRIFRIMRLLRLMKTTPLASGSATSQLSRLT